MRFDVLTIFPSLVRGAMAEGLLRRALDARLIEVGVHDLRDWSRDPHHKVDDQPFGGGGGMVMQPEPFFLAVEELESREPEVETTVILMCPQGRPLDQAAVRTLSATGRRLMILCGRYEGVDERVREHLVDLEISIGDYVLSGGEIPALVLIEAITRLLPGALGCSESAAADSFSEGILDFPHYTRPAEFRGWKVPDVLRSGDHRAIAMWRREMALRRTIERRPDLVNTISAAAPGGADLER